jgi:hypothetical protein
LDLLLIIFLFFSVAKFRTAAVGIVAKMNCAGWLHLVFCVYILLVPTCCTNAQNPFLWMNSLSNLYNAFANAGSDRETFSSASRLEVVRIKPAQESHLRQLNDMRRTDGRLDFWNAPSQVGAHVDVMVGERAAREMKHQLSSKVSYFTNVTSP